MKSIFIGLMSGTSLDGVDAALVSFAEPTPQILGTCYLPYPDTVREEALSLHKVGNNELHRSALLSQKLSQLYAEACHQLLSQSLVAPSSVTAIGCHGQTIRHRPEAGYSLQILNPSLLAELTSIPVITDFRNRDIAAGGQGAPLVPAAHADLFRSPLQHRALLNLGGIANLTNLPANKEAPVTGFDCGPANILLDAWIEVHQGYKYDRNGEWAKLGTVLPSLLERLLQHPFFHTPPPKSCGREEFNLSWLQTQLCANESPVNVQATLTELTALSCQRAILQWCPGATEIYVCGGGAHNLTLMSCLAALLPGVAIDTTSVLGVPPDWVEALAFAWLARQHVLGLPGSLPSVTGARAPRILGASYPA